MQAQCEALLLQKGEPTLNDRVRELLPCYNQHFMIREGRCRITPNTREWIEMLSSFDFCIGSRIHGLVVSILSGTPALLIAVDERQVVIAQYFKIPYLRKDIITRETPTDSLYQYAEENSAEICNNYLFESEIIAMNTAINQINDFNKYLDTLISLKQNTIIAVAKDTLVTAPFNSKITKEEYNKLNSIGFTMLTSDNTQEQFWCGYICIVKNGNVIYQNLVPKDDAFFYMSDNSLDISILSSPLRKRNKSSVIINGVETSVCKRGLNIVLLDGTTVVDSVSIDTWADKQMYRLPVFENEKLLNIKQAVRTKTLEKIDVLERQISRLEAVSSNILDFVKINIDPANLPDATGYKRLQQQACLALLRLLCDFLKRNNISYWLDGGTLIGAARSGKFIPWDDDIDISMDRQNYEHFKEVIYDFCTGDFTFSEGDIIRIFYKDTSAQIDIIPFDYGNSSEIPTGEAYEVITKKIQELYNKIPFDTSDYRRNCIPDYYLEKLPQIYREEILKNKPIPNNAYMFAAFHAYMPKRVLYSQNIIFPLREIKFEGFSFTAPNNIYAFISEVAGDFLSLPKTINNHGNGNNLSLDKYYKIKELINLSNNLSS